MHNRDLQRQVLWLMAENGRLQQQVDKLESDVYDLECELKEEPSHDGV